MLCDKCRKFFPPGFTHTENPKTGEPLRGNLCIFCIEGKEVLKYDKGKKISRKEIVKEYEIFLKRIKEDKKALLDGAKGEFIPGMEKLIV